MNEFPKMPERSVELPLGCKDLMDVEAIRNWKPVVHPDWPWRETTDRLAYIEGQLAHLLQSGGKSNLVSLSHYEDQGRIMIISDPDLRASVIFAHCRNALEQESTGKAFEEAGVAAVTEPVGRWKTKNALKCVLPEEASTAARLICEVLRGGYGLGILAMIKLSYYERKSA